MANATGATESRGCVCLVDADPAVHDQLGTVLEAAGFAVSRFVSARRFLARSRADGPTCVVLDAELPDADAVSMLEHGRIGPGGPPTIVTSKRVEVALAVRAMKAGAFDFLAKPVEPALLVERVGQALRSDTRRREEERSRRDAVERVNRLTAREAEVVGLVVEGRANKQIARLMRISQKTVEFHRARAMKKLEARHVSDLVRSVLLAGGRLTNSWHNSGPAHGAVEKRYEFRGCSLVA